MLEFVLSPWASPGEGGGRRDCTSSSSDDICCWRENAQGTPFPEVPPGQEKKTALSLLRLPGPFAFGNKLSAPGQLDRQPCHDLGCHRHSAMTGLQGQAGAIGTARGTPGWSPAGGSQGPECVSMSVFPWGSRGSFYTLTSPSWKNSRAKADAPKPRWISCNHAPSRSPAVPSPYSLS